MTGQLRSPSSPGCWETGPQQQSPSPKAATARATLGSPFHETREKLTQTEKSKALPTVYQQQGGTARHGRCAPPQPPRHDAGAQRHLVAGQAQAPADRDALGALTEVPLVSRPARPPRTPGRTAVTVTQGAFSKKHRVWKRAPPTALLDHRGPRACVSCFATSSPTWVPDPLRPGLVTGPPPNPSGELPLPQPAHLLQTPLLPSPFIPRPPKWVLSSCLLSSLLAPTAPWTSACI